MVKVDKKAFDDTLAKLLRARPLPFDSIPKKSEKPKAQPKKPAR